MERICFCCKEQSAKSLWHSSPFGHQWRVSMEYPRGFHVCWMVPVSLAVHGSVGVTQLSDSQHSGARGELLHKPCVAAARSALPRQGQNQRLVRGSQFCWGRQEVFMWGIILAFILIKLTALASQRYAPASLHESDTFFSSCAVSSTSSGWPGFGTGGGWITELPGVQQHLLLVLAVRQQNLCLGRVGNFPLPQWCSRIRHWRMLVPCL